MRPEVPGLTAGVRPKGRPPGRVPVVCARGGSRRATRSGPASTRSLRPREPSAGAVGVRLPALPDERRERLRCAG
eukprot:2745347-Lingulodinium_polyedra.AAC.1